MFTNETYLIVAYLSFFVASLFFSLLINGLFLRFSKTLGIRNTDETVIRWSSTSKPAFGGISFYIIFLLSITAYSFFFRESDYFLSQRFIGIIFATTLGFLMGLFDDAYNTKPLLKLFTQITCALILMGTGTYIQLTPWDSLNYALTIFWVVGMMNSINMLDNMDSITSLVSLSVIVTILGSGLIKGDFSDPLYLMLIGMGAALIGFLRYNWNPSKMYMGDTGSQFLGAFLAAMGIIYFWNAAEADGNTMQSKQIIVAVLAFLLPLIDTTTVFIKRIRKKTSPFVGGRDHTTHHLSYMGFSDRQVALTFLFVSLFSGFLVVLILDILPVWNLYYALIFSAYILIVFTIMFVIANKNVK